MNESSSAPLQPVAPAPAPENSAGHPHVKNGLFIGLAIMMGIIIVLLIYIITRNAPAPTIIVPQTPTPSSTTVVVPTVVENEDLTNAVLQVDWKVGRIVDPGIVFPGKTIPSEIVKTYESAFDEGSVSTMRYSYSFYEHGTVKDGAYRGQTVYSVVDPSTSAAEGGMGSGQVGRFFFLVDGTGLIRAIGRTRTDLPPEWEEVVVAPNLSIAFSEAPNELILENGKVVRRHERWPYLIGAIQPLCNQTGCVDRLPVAKTRDGKSLFTGTLQASIGGTIGTGGLNDPLEPGCLILYREDGLGIVYESVILTAARIVADGETVSGDREIGPTELTWEAPYANTSTFRTHRVGGCGASTCAEILTPEKMREEDIRETDLVRAGQTRTGEPLYVFKEAYNARDTSYFRPIQQAYEQWWEIDPTTSEKPTIGEFIRRFRVPVFLWKDALGRWTVYKNAAAFPLAECGKPVIYLYPEQTTDVHVKLPNFINVTVSEPTYPKNGWNVRATPEGKLTLLSDQTAWTSLFWEGTGVNYPVPETGFVVKQADVASFLQQTLAKYGLNTQETKDFMDFWVPEMQGAPYYQISFLTDTWSASAPLAVQPAPTKQIRLFMDWKKLAKPVAIQEPVIKTPTRSGFTLVEWGGLLR